MKTNKEIVNEANSKVYRGKYIVSEHDSLGQLSMARVIPDVKHELVWEDIGNPRGRFYKGFFLLDSKTNELHTWGNLPFRCPQFYNHHLGSVCRCCGLRG